MICRRATLRNRLRLFVFFADYVRIRNKKAEEIVNCFQARGLGNCIEPHFNKNVACAYSTRQLKKTRHRYKNVPVPCGNAVRVGTVSSCDEACAGKIVVKLVRVVGPGRPITVAAFVQFPQRPNFVKIEPTLLFFFLFISLEVNLHGIIMSTSLSIKTLSNQ